MAEVVDNYAGKMSRKKTEKLIFMGPLNLWETERWTETTPQHIPRYAYVLHMRRVQNRRHLITSVVRGDTLLSRILLLFLSRHLNFIHMCSQHRRNHHGK